MSTGNRCTYKSSLAGVVSAFPAPPTAAVVFAFPPLPPTACTRQASAPFPRRKYGTASVPRGEGEIGRQISPGSPSISATTSGGIFDFDDLDDKENNCVQISEGSVPRGVPTLELDAFGHVWDANRSSQLQTVVHGIEFPVTIADPNIPDCPLIACSVGFSRLTQYGLDEIVGKNCRFLLQGVPDDLIDEDTRFTSRRFCITALDDYGAQPGEEQEVPAALKAERSRWARSQGKPGEEQEVTMGEGEVLCVQTNARKSGELFRNMFFMKTVDLNDRPFILGLQAELDEGYEHRGLQLREECSEAFVSLGRNMGSIERLLASQFRHSGAMRCQA